MAEQERQLIDILMQAIDGALTDVHTATIARVTRVNATTINCRPVTTRIVDGQSVPLPEFVDVPPMFMQGGTSYTAHPIAVDDYCLLIFTERAFDRWYDGQDYQPPIELRMHDYSDGIAIVGIQPREAARTIPDRITHIGDTYQEGNYEHEGDRTQTGNYDLTGDYTQVGNMTIEGDFELTGDMVVNGNITCTGTIAAGNFSGLNGGAMSSDQNIETSQDVIAGTVSLGQHTHTDSQGGTTSEPT